MHVYGTLIIKGHTPHGVDINPLEASSLRKYAKKKPQNIPNIYFFSVVVYGSCVYGWNEMHVRNGVTLNQFKISVPSACKD